MRYINPRLTLIDISYTETIKIGSFLLSCSKMKGSNFEHNVYILLN